ncbi:MAG TPA: type II secretion system protein GspL [Pseudomonas sp.]|jgi:general secretion pathway protein L|nr:type II secretion system protein GspL [Pseudomonas sp.]
MLETWLFLPPEAAHGVDADLPVRRVSADGETTLALAAALAELTEPWCLVLPVEAVTICAVSLPTVKPRWLRKALPFAVEEWLAEEVEAFHLAVGERLGDGRHRVYALRRDWLHAWLQLCAVRPPREIRVDADLLPGDGPQLCRLDGRWLLGGDLPYRLAVEDADLPVAQALLPGPVPVCSEAQASEDSPHRWLTRCAAGCNLAQGEFAVREPAGDARRWRLPALALGLCLLLQWGFGLAQAWQLRQAGQLQAQASEQLYRELFPEDRKLINLRQQFDQHLAESQGEQEGLLALLGRAGPALAAEGRQVSVQQLDFSLTRGDLALQVQAPGFEALDRLRQRLVEAGLVVRLGSANREEAGVSARLVIGG